MCFGYNLGGELNVYKKVIPSLIMKKVNKSHRERNLHSIKTSRKLYVPFYAMAFAIVLFIVFIKYSGRGLNDMAFRVALFFIIGIIIATEVHRYGESYEITSKSVILNTGYFTILSKRIEFEAISDIHVRQGPWQRIMNFGDVQLFKFAPGPIMKNINRPVAVVNELEGIITRAKAGEHEEE